MNKQKFVDLLRQPGSISDSNLIELEELTAKNPYFNSAHTVIAKASKLLKSPQSNKRVNTAAIYATSRKALKKYIQGATEFKEAIVETVKIDTPQAASSNENLPNVLLSESDHNSLIDEVYDNIEEWRKSRNHFLEYELAIEEAGAKEKAKKSSDVDKIKSKIAKEIIAEEEEVAQAMKGIKKDAPKTKKKTAPPKPPKAKVTSAKKTPVVKASAKTSRTKASTTKKAPAKKAAKPKPSAKVAKDTDSTDGKKKKPKESINTKSKPKEDQSTIIDQFITTSPSIQTGKLKEFGEQNVDLSEKSNEFPTDIITENMANIFVSQGKTEKAISIYKKLILKSPEKKSYFASQIENLKK